jgi:predicted transcriptional regulator
MTTLTIRLPDDQHERLKTLAAQCGLSFNKLFEEFSTKAIAALDTVNRFRLRGATRAGWRYWRGWSGSLLGRRGETS